MTFARKRRRGHPAIVVSDSSETLTRPLSWNAPVEPLNGPQSRVVLEVRRFSYTRAAGSAAARRVTGRPSQRDSARSSSAVCRPEG